MRSPEYVDLVQSGEEFPDDEAFAAEIEAHLHERGFPDATAFPVADRVLRVEVR